VLIYLIGPFADEAAFNTELVAIHEKAMSKAQLKPLVAGALTQNKHKIVLTHGDFRGGNILVAGDQVVGLLDWETCGWYPEYWEFVKSFNVLPWVKGWPEFILKTLSPYHCQWVVYDLITRHVW
jgi:Ser/Thr protein kinase RdoA (MazF antagonist)